MSFLTPVNFVLGLFAFAVIYVSLYIVALLVNDARAGHKVGVEEALFFLLMMSTALILGVPIITLVGSDFRKLIGY